MTDPSALLALIEKLEARYTVAECWIWPRKVDATGRGRIWVNGKITLAHRAVWQCLRGAIPSGGILCHRCDNPSCVNPTHIYVGTHADNMRDMRERRRSFGATQPERIRAIGRRLGLSNVWCKGAANPKAKLTSAQVDKIRGDSRATRFLVAEYGVDRTTIQRIRRGSQWARAAQ